MDESVNNDTVITKSNFMDDAIKCFAQNLFKEQEEQMGRSEPEGKYLIDPPGGQTTETFVGANYTKEEIEDIVKKDMKDAGLGDADHACAARCKKDRAVDYGCPLLDNMDLLWHHIGEVFTEYKTSSPSRLLDLLRHKCPNCTLHWQTSGHLQINGAATVIAYQDVEAVFKALKKLVSDKTADRIIASILAKKIKKLF